MLLEDPRSFAENALCTAQPYPGTAVAPHSQSLLPRSRQTPWSLSYGTVGYTFSETQVQPLLTSLLLPHPHAGPHPRQGHSLVTLGKSSQELLQDLFQLIDRLWPVKLMSTLDSSEPWRRRDRGSRCHVRAVGTDKRCQYRAVPPLGSRQRG